MADIVGVRYKRAGRIYYFDPDDLDLAPGDRVVVETSRGRELGWVVIAPTQVSADEIVEPLKCVVRKATEEDLEHAQKLEDKEAEALAECGQLVDELGLPMKLIEADVNLDNSRLVIYFSAAGRVDFRELVRELSRRLKMRVELRQLGPRDEAKMVGGFGRCGRELCCQGFICEFNPVSIKMAKAQNLPLNPMKISGVCGRLLCCLGYEYEQYRCLKQKLPREGQQVATSRGTATVIGVNIMEEKVLVELEGGDKMELPVAEIDQDIKASPEKKAPSAKKFSSEKKGGQRRAGRDSRWKKG